MESDVYNYQLYVQNLQNILVQKQSLQLQLEEIKQTVEELSKYNKDKVYKSVGPILIEKKKDDVISELNDTKEELEIKLKAIEKQEEMVKKKIDELKDKLKSYSNNGI